MAVLGMSDSQGSGAVAGGIGGSLLMGPGMGTIIGGVAGALGLGGIFGGTDDSYKKIQAMAPNTSALGAAFQSAADPTQQQQKIATAVLQAHPELGSAQNAMNWYNQRQSMLQAAGGDVNGSGVSSGDRQILATIQSQLQTTQATADMSSSAQNQAVFGNQGSNWLNTAANQQITGPDATTLQNMGNNAAGSQATNQYLMGQAGVGPMSAEQLAQQQARNAAFTTQAMQPLQQQIASQQATSERSNQAHGFGYDPNMQRQAMDNATTAGQNVGLSLANMNSQLQQNALMALPGALQQGQATSAAQFNLQNQVQQQQAGLGQQQAAMGLGGFGTVGNLAQGGNSLSTQQYLGQLNANTQEDLQAKQAQAQQTGALISAGGSLLAGGAAASSGSGGGGGMMGMMGMFSDRNLKKNITPADEELQAFLDELNAHSYEYINPKHGEGRFISPMAQEFEKTSLGKTMVVHTPEGKMINYAAGFGVLLASVAYLNRKLKD